MLAPWKESYDQPRKHIKKQRHYLVNKSLSSQGYGFSSSHVWMWELDYKESWAPKNWCFWTVGLEKIPWTARRSNQSILNEISPECSVEELMLKLKLQYFGHMMRRADSFEKTLILGKTDRRRRRRMRWLDPLNNTLHPNFQHFINVVLDGLSTCERHNIKKLKEKIIMTCEIKNISLKTFYKHLVDVQYNSFKCTTQCSILL